MPANRTVSPARWRSSRLPEAAYPTGRKLSERLIQQSKALAKSVGNPHAIALSILADGIMAIGVGRMEKGLDAVRAGAGDPARPVRRGHVGIEHGAESRDLGPHVSGRAR